MMDWEKWMAEHHVKIGGKSHDNGSDAVSAGGGISRSEMETKMSDDARATGDSYIQESKRKG